MVSGSEKIHWYARQGNFVVRSGVTGEMKTQTLCGYWAEAGEWTKNEAEVTCQGCVRSSTSKRTIEKGRLDY